MTALEIKGMKIGEGLPKTIISLMDPTVDETIETIKTGIEVGVDAFEWRGDFAADLHDPAQMAANSKLIAAATPNNPLLFTMRTIEAGGQATLPVDEYVALNKAIIEAGAIDMVDIDIELGEESTMELVAFAKEHQVATVISYHNFRGTPSAEWMSTSCAACITSAQTFPRSPPWRSAPKTPCACCRQPTKCRSSIMMARLLTMAMVATAPFRA